MSDNGKQPLYLRGFNRAQANRIVKMYKRRYQPPIECAHEYGKPFDLEGATMRECRYCGFTVGVLR